MERSRASRLATNGNISAPVSHHSAPQAGASFRNIAEHPQDGLPWYAEIEKLDSEECQEALVMGWRRGLFSQAQGRSVGASAKLGLF